MNPRRNKNRRRALVVATLIVGAFLVEGAKLTELGLKGSGVVRSEPVEVLARRVARPDIVDRTGRLLATDVAQSSLYVDPGRVIDKDEVAEKLGEILSGIDQRELLAALQDKTRRFVWVKRALTAREAERVHDLGLPGVAFRDELRRVYPAGEDAGHVLGLVDVENRGASGIERYIDSQGLVDVLDGAGRSQRTPLMLSLDIAVQHSLRSELEQAEADFGAAAAAGVVLDVESGEVLADVSLPDFGAGNGLQSLEPERLDRIAGGTFELGSVFKAITLAMAKDAGVLDQSRTYDTRRPLQVGAYSIDDFHPTRRLLTAEEVFLHSSNIGASLMAQDVGEERMHDFFDRLGLTTALITELGSTASPQLPARWGKLATMTMSYGHGIAVSPLQFAAAAASLVGETQFKPTFLKRVTDDQPRAASRLVAPETGKFLRLLLRHNVTNPEGTGKRAFVAGYDVGGKTGTADIAGKGGYGHSGVLSSFLAVWPIRQPRFLSYILLWAPQSTEADHGQTAAGLTAAPVTARLISRISPLLGLAPVYGDDGT